MAIHKTLSDKIKDYAPNVDLDSAFQELQEEIAHAKPALLSEGDRCIARAAASLMAAIDRGTRNEITSSDAMLFANVAQAITAAKGNGLLTESQNKVAEEVLFALEVLCEHCGESVSPEKQIARAG